MKQTLSIFAAFCICGFGVARAADSAEESRLISVLQSSQPVREKAAACASLKRVGTSRSVPALAALLTDNELSHSARYALESLPGQVAEYALLNALPQTSGSNEVGIIHSLAVRRDPAAVNALAKLLGNSDSAVETAAAEGLGRIGGTKAIKALEYSRQGPAEVDGLLECGNQLLTKGDDAAALKIFRQLYDREQTGKIGTAAFRGMILASGHRGLAMATKAIAGNDPVAQGVALALASKIPGSAATTALAGLLPKAPAPVQIALLQCLGQRRDPAASAAVAQFVNSPDADVRMEAIIALGNLGDESAVLPLASRAASSTGAERNAAREALVELRHGPVTSALTGALTDASPEVRLEIIRALGDRGDNSAAAAILPLARSENEDISSGSLQALGLLGGGSQAGELLKTIIQTTNDDLRSGAANALGLIYQRLESQHQRWDAQALGEALKNAPAEARIALLPICSELAEAPVRDSLRLAVNDSDPKIRDAAIEALSETRDAQLLPDLVKAATTSPEQRFRTLAIGGCVRITTREEGINMTVEQKISVLKAILGTSLDAPEKKLILSGLSTIPDSQALALATPLLDDPSVRSEAAQAVIQIAASISPSQPAEAGDALKKVLAMSISPAARNSAEKAYKRIQ
jgi:HEAT repeat protein